MGRLIDADRLNKDFSLIITHIENSNKEIISKEEFIKCLKILRECVDEQPTAYNVEKVVKKIKKRTCKKCRNILGPVDAEKYCKEVNCEIEAVCEIVRRGGVDERT